MKRLADVTIEEMIELARRHELADEVRREIDRLRLEIGTGAFRSSWTGRENCSRICSGST